MTDEAITLEQNEDFRELQQRPELTDFILSYMHPPLVMSVCQQWNSVATAYPAKMRTYEVEYIRIHCNQGSFENCETFRGTYMDVKNISTSAMRYGESSLPDVFIRMRFLYTKDLRLLVYNQEQLQEINQMMPVWWKPHVTKLVLSQMKNSNSGYYLLFMRSFPNLHSLKIVLFKDLVRGLPCIESMSSVRKFSLTSTEEPILDSDDLIDAICAKSNIFEFLHIEGSVSAEVLINFVKKGNFAKSVKLYIGSVKGGLMELDKVKIFFLTTAEKCKINNTDTTSRFDIKFRDSTFLLLFDNV